MKTNSTEKPHHIASIHQSLRGQDEHAALVAVAEAAKELEAMLDALAPVLPSGVPPQISGRFKQSLANLAAVREGKTSL